MTCNNLINQITDDNRHDIEFPDSIPPKLMELLREFIVAVDNAPWMDHDDVSTAAQTLRDELVSNFGGCLVWINTHTR